MKIDSVGAWMKSPMVVRESTTLRALVDEMRTRGERHTCVVEGETLVGIISDRDVRAALPSPLTGYGPEEYALALDSHNAGEVMTRTPRSVTPETSLREAALSMVEHRIHSLPVLEGRKLVGILTDSCCMRALIGLLGSWEARRVSLE